MLLISFKWLILFLDDNSTAFENCTADLNNDDTINVSDITLTIENITGD